MLIDIKSSCLILVDVQEKLLPFVQEPKRLVTHCEWMMRLARELDVPMLISEQYPQGLGKTVDELTALSDGVDVIEKVHFSCAADINCLNRINDVDKKQVILIGMETAVCILQTALELTEKGKQVFVAADCVSGRHTLDSELAFSRMRQAGVQVVSKEMVFFEWLRHAGNKRFKALSKAFLQ